MEQSDATRAKNIRRKNKMSILLIGVPWQPRQGETVVTEGLYAQAEGRLWFWVWNQHH